MQKQMEPCMATNFGLFVLQDEYRTYQLSFEKILNN